MEDCYLDELPPDRGRIDDEIPTDCGVMCYLALEEQKEEKDDD